MDFNQAMQWQALIAQAVVLGVKSWAAIRALAQDAGLDDAQLEFLRPRWDALVDDVRRAAQDGS